MLDERLSAERSFGADSEEEEPHREKECGGKKLNAAGEQRRNRCR